jgi:hypothetical protein
MVVVALGLDRLVRQLGYRIKKEGHKKGGTCPPFFTNIAES